MTEAEVRALGTGLSSRMSMEQLEAAYLLYLSITRPIETSNTSSISQSLLDASHDPEGTRRASRRAPFVSLFDLLDVKADFNVE